MERVQRPEPGKQKIPRVWVGRIGVYENQMRKCCGRMETETYKSSCVEKEKEDGWASTRRQCVVNLMGNSSKGIGAGSRWGKKSGRDATSGTGCQRGSPHPSSNRKTDYSLLLEHKIFIVQWLRAIPSTWNSQPGCTQNEESNTCILYRTTGKVISLN